MRFFLLATLFALSSTLDAQESGDKRLTLEDTNRGGISFRGTTPAWKWAPDGEHLIRGRGKKVTWVNPETFEELGEAPDGQDADGAGLDEEAAKALAGLEGIDEERARKIVRSESSSSDDDSTHVYLHDGELFVWERGRGARRLETEGEVELPDLSPDKTRVGYVVANNLYVQDLATGKLRALTNDGGVNVFNGKLDWVYQEEIYGRYDFKAFWWSPDGESIAFLRLDETDVDIFTVVDHVEKDTFRSLSELTKYPKAGDTNPIVAIGVAEVANGAIDWVDMRRYKDVEPLVVRVGWTPDSSKVVYMVQDRIQTWLDLNLYDRAKETTRTLIQETSDSWTYRLPEPQWLEDGTFLWQSDRTGYRHVYHYRPSGELVGAVTKGDWQITGIDWVDEERGLMAFTGTKDGAINRNTYIIGLDGDNLTRITQGTGQHSVSFNEARTLALDTWSSRSQPPLVRLVDLSGKIVRELGRTEVPKLEEYATSTWELTEIEARDGYPLDVAVLKPTEFDPNKSYPVWVSTYSGPNAPTIRNRWSPSTWNQFLAQNGVIVLNCNVRSASGKGLHATSTCYKRLGIQELKDLQDAVKWLTRNGWADEKRVGITGYSYGGFMTAFALTHSKDFRLGVAGGGVYDWGMYDSIYTERYMSTPQRNEEGYAETSVIDAAGNLSGHLVMTHGTKDDNVHVQNAIQLAYALQKAGKDFEMMLYPESRHGIRDADQRRFDRRLTWRAIQEHLLPEATTTP